MIRTPLFSATYNGDLEEVKHLVANGASLSEKDHIGRTPLMLAAFRGHLDVVEFLLANGASSKVCRYARYAFRPSCPLNALALRDINIWPQPSSSAAFVLFAHSTASQVT